MVVAGALSGEHIGRRVRITDGAQPPRNGIFGVLQEVRHDINEGTRLRLFTFGQSLTLPLRSATEVEVGAEPDPQEDVALVQERLDRLSAEQPVDS